VRRDLVLTVCLVLVTLVACATTMLSGCSAPPAQQQTQIVVPTQTASTTDTSGATGEPTSTVAEDSTTPVTSTATTTPAEKPKAKKPATETMTKPQAAAAMMKAVNATIDQESDPRANVTSVDVRVLEKASNGTWWAGGYLANDLDGGIVFAKKAAGGAWVIVDMGTGIDGSEMEGKAPAAIAAKFAAEFTP
jgi:hypothetical protein